MDVQEKNHAKYMVLRWEKNCTSYRKILRQASYFNDTDKFSLAWNLAIRQSLETEGRVGRILLSQIRTPWIYVPLIMLADFQNKFFCR